MKKVSIIIPFHSYKNYLKECFKSLDESSFQDFEVILIMDRVKENIDKLIDKYQQKFDLKVIESSNKGVAAARNIGIQEASGEYIYFLDSDDYVLEDTLSLLSEAINGQDLIYGKVSNTWNNKANYLEKLANKEEDADDLEEIEQQRLANVQEYQRELGANVNLDKEMAIYYLCSNRKGFRNFTVLGNLYKLSFIKENNLKFNESFRYYSDMTFMIPFLDKVKTAIRVEDARYIKRKHNDPVNKPALWQEENDNRFKERLEAIEYTRSLVDVDSNVRFYLDRKLLIFYVYNFGRKVRRSKDDLYRTTYFDILRKYVAGCNERSVSSLKHWQKKMVKALLNDDLNKVKKLVRWRLGKKKFVNIFKNKNVLYKAAYFHIFMKKPVKKDVVMFESFFGKNYSDSPKYIYEYLGKNYSDKYTFVWALNNKTKLPYGGKVVKRFSFKYAYYLAVSKYLVFNVRQPLWYRKKEDQIFIETWHGTPLKRLVFDQEEVTSASPKYKQQFFRQRSEWDYLVSANEFSTNTFRSCFMYEGDMLDFGYPRNDILYREDKDEFALNLKKKLGIPADKKTILYAPTWRDDEHYGSGEYKFTLALDLKLMKEKLSDEYVVLLRTHHYIADNIDTTGLEGFTYNLSKYNDISEIYLISDICITDYSSVFFDYANLKRPILFYTYDIEKYKNQLRGFYISMQDEVPGPLLYTSEEVINAISNIEDINSEYALRYEEFYNRFCAYDDGFASKKIVDKVFLNKE